MLDKIFGIAKLIIGLTSIIFTILILLPLLRTNLIVENIIGFAILILYGFFQVLSGWTIILKKMINEKILLIGAIISIILIFSYISLLGLGKISGNILIDSAITIMLISLLIHDSLRIKRNKYTS